MIEAQWAPYRLDFKFEARTSRDTMLHKDTFFVRLTDKATGRTGIGECALFRGLSSDDIPDYEQQLQTACANPANLSQHSSIRFGLESAAIDGGMHGDVPRTPFLEGLEGIPINGLIWMGTKAEMAARIDAKLADGFSVLKLKIGGIDFESELDLLRSIRRRYSASSLELRLDANGSFSPADAMERLQRLSCFGIHSIEQPIRAGQLTEMARICRVSPIPIALDEELIGTPTRESIETLLDTVAPQYIILKPSLCGGVSAAGMWADEAERRDIGWWATSALESNVGLLAIARWLAGRGIQRPQGLGTGQLYYNNIPSGLYLRGSMLYYNPEKAIELPTLPWRN